MLDVVSITCSIIYYYRSINPTSSWIASNWKFLKKIKIIISNLSRIMLHPLDWVARSCALCELNHYLNPATICSTWPNCTVTSVHGLPIFESGKYEISTPRERWVLAKLMPWRPPNKLISLKLMNQLHQDSLDTEVWNSILWLIPDMCTYEQEQCVPMTDQIKLAKSNDPKVLSIVTSTPRCFWRWNI